MPLDYRRHPVDDRSMGGMLRWAATQHPDRVAIICGETRWTWRELDLRVNRAAHALLGLGIRPGDRVGLYFTNHPDYLALYLACAKTGIVATAVNPALTSTELTFILGDAGCVLVITDAARAAVVAQARPDLPALVVGADYDELLAAAVDTEPPGIAGTDVPFYQGYTSGTTGFPKGCVQTHRAFVDHHWRCHDALGSGYPDVMLIPGPLFHEAPALFSLEHLLFGGTVVVLPVFTPEAALEAIVEHRCTLVGFAVPVMLARMCDLLQADSARYDVTGLRSIVVAGAPLLEDTLQASLRAFPNAVLREFYGGTELGVVTSVDHRVCPERGRTAGIPLRGIALLILSPEGALVPPGEVGEVFASPVMMAGYHGRPDATAEAVREFDGVSWISLGDLGFLDKDGYLYLVDRKKHMIISGGENVYPVEIENVLAEHPAVADVAVIGLPDARWGEKVTAVVVAAAGRSLTLEELDAHCRDRLAGYKIPKHLVVLEDLPRTPSGKVLKHVLRDQLT
jgi:acyl-CoA synthetase (AMP-forming)/AMP-acid ligase II